MAADKKSIVFFHPDLGIGGAERLVIDAAVGLQNLGHKVTVYTSYCDKSHCFEEARDGTLDVRVRGDGFIPQTIAGRFSIFCAILRQLHLVLAITLISSELDTLKPTHFFIDQLSAAVPLLRLLYDNVGILFYCHFPDQLLVQKETSGLLGAVKDGYRIPFNWIESSSTAASDGIVVNSNFTASVVKRVFPQLNNRDLKVVYPCVDISAATDENRKSLWPDRKVFLSINRFEKKKDVALAIKAFAGLEERERKNALLVIAGGHDPRIPENVHTHVSLQALADSFSLNHTTLRSNEFTHSSQITPDTSILFLLSFSDKQKTDLLASASLLIYTPQNEHFGIVPLESMLSRVPVLAANEGGPLETVVEGSTGWLRDIRQPAQWTAVMQKVLDLSNGDNGKRLLKNMGQAGRERVFDIFSKEAMARSLDESLQGLVGQSARLKRKEAEMELKKLPLNGRGGKADWTLVGFDVLAAIVFVVVLVWCLL
ncbi:hypothetical protein AAFC00_001921 [Neodothiora populina]|uniref:Alpha-1,3/1,6-mannosyltransferase ALG2 n=1 Tax=Neodothiora populina TaxID=2781224 RepID=A0ABR3PQT9_9PEZI